MNFLAGCLSPSKAGGCPVKKFAGRQVAQSCRPILAKATMTVSRGFSFCCPVADKLARFGASACAIQLRCILSWIGGRHLLSGVSECLA